MELAGQQVKAARQLEDFLQGPAQVFKFHGYAGTGKSTVISHVLGGREGVTFAAPTAKATSVLRNKGVDAFTLHSLMYQPVEVIDQYTKKPKLIFKENPKSPLWQGGIVVVDESSMVGAGIAEDLVKYPIKVIAVGDPGQLPPVMSKGNQSLLSGRPDAMLTEVHRQALDSPVLWLATYVREHDRLPPGNFNEGGSRIVSRSTDAGRMDSFDQVIVGTHKRRFATNAHIRKLRGYTDPLPYIGEEILCKKNDLEKGLVNGQKYRVTSRIEVDDETMLLSVDGPDGVIHTTAWVHGFHGPDGIKELEQMSLKDRGSNVEFWHGEAITCHSSQGSEWDNVLVSDESRVFGKAKGKWLYTGVTRASEKVTIVR